MCLELQKKMKIIIVYNNEANHGLKSGWGFSCLVEDKEKILFDTGDSGKKLIYNMKQLNIEPKDIGKVVISHNHWDHTGGLRKFLEANDKAQVFHPKSFSNRTEICPGIYSTGALGTFIKEQSLVINTQKGNIIITGCAHPGLEHIIEKSRELGEIYGVIGGFHGFSNLEKLQEINLIAPCHCTQYKQEIKQSYPAQFREIKAGDIIEI
jgi:7,8-dihydropterin-6-yl-methyl-4-(beta-D-ribofuranosyl)aminobenzene 5'-phosphate synthase